MEVVTRIKHKSLKERTTLDTTKGQEGMSRNLRSRAQCLCCQSTRKQQREKRERDSQKERQVAHRDRQTETRTRTRIHDVRACPTRHHICTVINSHISCFSTRPFFFLIEKVMFTFGFVMCPSLWCVCALIYFVCFFLEIEDVCVSQHICHAMLGRPISIGDTVHEDPGRTPSQ